MNPTLITILFAANSASSLPVVPPEERAVTLDTVVVVASRMPEPLKQAASAATVLDRMTLDDASVVGIEDLSRLVPGLAVPNDPSRFGAQGFSLRGLDGNRVVLLFDGIPQPDGFGVGAFSLAGRDAIELSVVDRIEVLRGPASTLYGSKALAGVIAASSRDPGDDFRPGESGVVGGARLGFDDRSSAAWLSTHLAGASGDGWQWLGAAGQLRGSESENRAWRPRDQPNPADVLRSAALLKLVRDADIGRRWTFTVEGDEARRETDVQSLVGGPGRYATTTALTGNDVQRRTRASLGLDWSLDGLVDRVDSQVWWQRQDIDQRTVQDRLPDRASPFPNRRDRRFLYEQAALGLGLVAQSAIGAHRIVYGVDVLRQRHEELRDGAEIDLRSGASRPVLLGEVYPLRDFPISTVTEIGVFVQDDWTLRGGFSVIAGLRAERLSTKSEEDAVWRADNPNALLINADNRALAPKLGLRWLGRQSTVWLQRVRGYRAPPFSDLNIGLNLPALGYVALPNPDLRPERSDGWELGLRWQAVSAQVALVLFQNRYRDLIESRAPLGPNADGDLVFQSANRERARIEGAELEASTGLDALNPEWATLRVSAVAAWARGRDLGRDRVLESVTPASVSLRLAHASTRGSWGGGLGWRAVRGPQADDALRIARFVPPGFSEWDANLWFRLGGTKRLQLDVRNLADRRYWEWSSLRGLAPTAPDIGRYTASGRSVRVQLLVAW